MTKRTSLAGETQNRWLENLARRVVRAMNRRGTVIGLALVDDREIRRLNRRYRGKDRATDVLAFSLDIPLKKSARGAKRSKARLIGDVVISLPTARRQAAERELSVRSELARLLIHGLLHLLGYDHERPNDAARMRRVENRLTRQFHLEV